MVSKIFCVVILCILLIGRITAQGYHHQGSHEIQALNHPVIYSGIIDPGTISKSARSLNKIVFGYHPYWISSLSIDRYRFDLLSHVAYFSYEVDPSTGLYTTIHEWLTTPLVEKAKQAGTKALLVATNFGAGANRTLLSSPSARNTLITTLARLVKVRGGDGINIDFESVSGDQRANLTSFFSELKKGFNEEIPGSIVSAAVPAVDWNGAWDVAELSRYIDIFFVMCYDYYWAGSSIAGPVSPLEVGIYNVKRSLEWYLANGVPKDKIVMGIPYYGYDWPVETSLIQSPTTGTGIAMTYSAVRNALQNYTRLWDNYFKNPWYKYQTTSWRQCWYDDEMSLELKYDLALDLEIAGVGIWALGYDGAFSELWNLIEQKFAGSVLVEDAPNLPIVSIDFVYPNPVNAQSNVFFVSFTIPEQRIAQENISVSVIDPLGRRIHSRQERAKGGRNILPIQVAGIANGLYQIVLEYDEYLCTKRLIICK